MSDANQHLPPDEMDECPLCGETPCICDDALDDDIEELEDDGFSAFDEDEDADDADDIGEEMPEDFELED